MSIVKCVVSLEVINIRTHPRGFFLHTIYSYIGDRVPDFNSLCNVIIYFKKQKVRKKVKSMPELMKQTQPSDL